ncbi:hypothetical protein HNR40_007524 [Nonomuraea endophytica]|uniref:Uncharacterized protein n=1 Tax=Nonomuraea endophytica TaxID=714136 RepID=A0A7W8EJU6_9ACTN|nr:hypothetical protein [Nonomuraea endophytica]
MKWETPQIRPLDIQPVGMIIINCSCSCNANAGAGAGSGG